MQFCRALLHLLAAVWAVQAGAQTLVTGSVRGGGRLLRGAEVRFEPGNIVAHTDTTGTYVLVAPGGGVVRLFVRAVGFYAVGRNMLLVANDTVTSDFALDPVAQQLDSLSVEVTGPAVRGKMAAFEERRRMGVGRFFTRAMLAEREHSTVSDVLRMTPGLRLIRRPSVCGGGFSVGTGRGGVVQGESWMKCGPGRVPIEPACYFAIYLDGSRYWVPGSREPPDINQFQIHGIQAMEVYRGPAETPIQYQATNMNCGLVMLWTRDGS